MSIIEKAAQRLAEKQAAAQSAAQSPQPAETPALAAGIRQNPVPAEGSESPLREQATIVTPPSLLPSDSVPPLAAIPQEPDMAREANFTEGPGRGTPIDFVSPPSLIERRRVKPLGLSTTSPEDLAPEVVMEPAAAEQVLRITSLDPDTILSLNGGRTRLAEEFRIIKRPLLVRALGASRESNRYNNLIMVTSAMQGEGKTFVSLNLGISIAMEMDSTVLLVDADVARPGLSKLLGIPQRPGLIERLTDQHTDLADLLIRTDIPKLTVLPAGKPHQRSTELLASNKMQRLLDELASRYPDRIVLFDSPPLLVTTEAAVLAAQMGQVLVVVESDGTSQVLVKEALAQFNSLDNVSLVLNKYRERTFAGRLTGYGYGYGYGYYGEAEANKARDG